MHVKSNEQSNILKTSTFFFSLSLSLLFYFILYKKIRGSFFINHPLRRPITRPAKPNWHAAPRPKSTRAFPDLWHTHIESRSLLNRPTADRHVISPTPFPPHLSSKTMGLAMACETRTVKYTPPPLHYYIERI